jgi:hypothetical protein
MAHRLSIRPLFNRLARIGAAAALGLALTTGTAAAQNMPPDSVKNITLTPAGEDISDFLRQGAPEIRALKAEFAQTPLGAQLLRYVRDRHIRLVIDNTLAARNSAAEYEPANGTISIAPGMKMEAAVIRLAHEIRHGWQDKTLNAYALERGPLTPWQRWTLRRYMEADAEAYAGYFEANRLQQGVKMQDGFAEVMPSSMIAMRLRGEYWSRDGITFAEYRRLGFEPALEGLAPYNARHLAFVEDMAKTYAGAPGQPPGDAAFETFLRRFGGVSFNIDAATALQSRSVTAETILRAYPRREGDLGFNPSFLPILDAKIASLEGKTPHAPAKKQPRPSS